MKKQILLALLSMATLTGCGGIGYHTDPINESKSLLISTSEATQEGSEELGLRLPLSQSSSLGVDVNGIIDYFKGSTAVESLAKQQAIHDPWVCFSASF